MFAGLHIQMTLSLRLYVTLQILLKTSGSVLLIPKEEEEEKQHHTLNLIMLFDDSDYPTGAFVYYLQATTIVSNVSVILLLYCRSEVGVRVIPSVPLLCDDSLFMYRSQSLCF